jgi:SulP family sulfate permease
MSAAQVDDPAPGGAAHGGAARGSASRLAGAIAALAPRRSDYAGVARTWRADVVAGLTVGVVALPLALAFGITTGLGASAGLATAIVAGFVAAVLGGSDVQVSGPTGAMTVVLVPLVARHGPDAVVVVGVLAGLLVVAAGALRLGGAHA